MKRNWYVVELQLKGDDGKIITCEKGAPPGATYRMATADIAQHAILAGTKAAETFLLVRIYYDFEVVEGMPAISTRCYAVHPFERITDVDPRWTFLRTVFRPILAETPHGSIAVDKTPMAIYEVPVEPGT